MARILIVEDKVFFATALTDILKVEGHSFLFAPNTTIAGQILQREDFDCAIIDAKMASFSGLEFALWLLRNKPTPVILMAGFSDQVDAAAPFGLKEATLLVMPFQHDDVRQALRKAISATVLTGPAKAQEAMSPIPRGSLKIARPLELSLYHYTQGRPRKLLNRGEPFVIENLNIPIDTRFYTDRESLSNLLKDSFTGAAGAATNIKIDPVKRAEIMQNVLQIINEQMEAMGVERATTETAVEMLTMYLRSIDDKAIWEMISSLDSYSRPIYAQTLAVTMICLIVAHEYEYSTQECFKLATAALFHDIGYTTLDSALLKTPRPLLSMKDRALLDRHVEIGVAILQKSGWVSAEVCTIVWQHHESVTGSGFPRGLKTQDIHPLARLLHLADEFCLSVMKSGGQPGVSPLRAAELMKSKRELDQNLVLSLQRILTRSRANVVSKK